MRNGIRIVGMACLSFCVLVLSGCATPGNFLTPADVSKPMHDGNRVIEPKVIPIDAALIRRTHAQQADMKSPSFVPPLYRVRPHDILNIFVWNHPELTVPYLKSDPSSNINRTGVDYGIYQRRTQSGTLVDSMGYISFPFVGRVRVSGMTTYGIAKIIRKKLRKYIKLPRVTVRISSYRSRNVFVMGEVKFPETEEAITDRPKTIMMAINEAGGINPKTADPSHIYVIRGSVAQPVVYWLDARSPSALLASEKFILEPNDIVYVATAAVSRWNRVINQIIPNRSPVGIGYVINQPGT